MAKRSRLSRPAFEPWPMLKPLSSRLTAGPLGEKAFYYDSGLPAPGGNTFVLIHGLGDEADSWRHLFPLLSRRHRLVAVDLPGFGRSDPLCRGGLAAHADFVVDFLEAAFLDKVILVGSSLGAVVAELVAFRAGDRVAGLVLLDGGFPVSGAAPALGPLVVPGRGERFYESLRGRPEAAYESLRPYYRDLEALSMADRGFLALRVVARVENPVQEKAFFSLLRSAVLWGAFKSAVFRKGLAAFHKPLLALWGSDDAMADRGTAALVASLAPDSAVAIIEGAGHLVQQDRPEALAEALERFSTRLGR